MALSPVVTHTASSSRAVSSPLRVIGSGQTTNASGTPKPTAASGPATIPPSLDLAEQANEEVKRLYIKGKIKPFLPQ